MTLYSVLRLNTKLNNWLYFVNLRCSLVKFIQNFPNTKSEHIQSSVQQPVCFTSYLYLSEFFITYNGNFGEKFRIFLNKLCKKTRYMVVCCDLEVTSYVIASVHETFCFNVKPSNAFSDGLMYTTLNDVPV